MKRLVFLILLFAAIKVAGQTTGYLRFDTVRIYKQGGTAELYLINKTKDSLGLLTNVGGGLTQFRRSRVLNDSTIVVGLDTLILRGASGGGSSGQLQTMVLPPVDVHAGDSALGIPDTLALRYGYGLTATDSDTTLIVDTFSISTRSWRQKGIDSVVGLLATAGVPNANVGAGYRPLKPSTQEIKTIFPRYGELIDSTTNTNGLTIGPDTSSMATRQRVQKGIDSLGAVKVNVSDTAAAFNPYPRGSGAASQVTYWKSTRAQGGENEFTYNETTNLLDVDSSNLFHSKQDSLLLNPYRIIRLADSLVLFGNSITEGSAASPIGDSAYAPRLARYLNLTSTNRAQSGAGIKTPQTRHFTYINPGHNAMTTLMIGFNDIHSNDINGATGFKTKNMLYNGINAIFINHFLKSWISASDAGVTRFGSWSTGYQDSRNGQKGTSNCAFTSTTNDSMTYVFTDSTVVFVPIGGDGSAGASIGTTVQVYIDGVLNQTISTNNQADNILSLSPDNSAGGRERTPMGVIITGLTYASHKIKIVKSAAGGFLIVNFFGHLRDARTAPPFVLFDIPWMKAAGYAPGSSSTVKTDTMNAKFDSLRATWPVAYPVYAVQTNNFYDTTTGTSGDNIHPNNTGHRQIFNAAENVLPSIFKTALRIGSLFATGDNFYGVTDSGRKKFIMENVFYGDTSNNIRNRPLTASYQNASFKVSQESDISNRLRVRGAILGHNLTAAGDSSMSVGENTSGRPYVLMNFRSGTTNNKRSDMFSESSGGDRLVWRLVNDANSAATEYRNIYRNGIIPDSIIERANAARWYNVPGAGLPTRLSLSLGSDGKAGIGKKTPIYSFDILDSVTSQTSGNRGVNVDMTGATFNTNTGAFSTYGGYFKANGTRGSGSNVLTNIGVYGTASGAQVNLAAQFDGDVMINGTPTGVVTNKILVKGTDSLIKQIPASLFATQSALNDTAAALRALGGGSADGNGIYTGGGSLSADVNVLGNSHLLNLGTSGNKLTSFSMNTSGNGSLSSDARLFLLGNITYQAVNHTSDADLTVAANTGVLELSSGSLTTDRTITLPTASSHGQVITIVVRSTSSSNHYVLSAAVPDVKTGSTFTQLEYGTTYDFMVNASTAWMLIRKY